MKLKNTLGLAIADLQPAVEEDYPTIHFFHGRLLVAGWLAWSGGFDYISQYHRRMFMPTREQIMARIEMFYHQNELIALIEDGLRQKRALEPPKPMLYIPEELGFDPVYLGADPPLGLPHTPRLGVHPTIQQFTLDYPVFLPRPSDKESEVVAGVFDRISQFVRESNAKALLPKGLFR